MTNGRDPIARWIDGHPLTLAYIATVVTLILLIEVLNLIR